jgi:hypothetical protein
MLPREGLNLHTVFTTDYTILTVSPLSDQSTGEYFH